ncbi:MAG: ABC transporter permease DevC [Acidobacteriota bacterium]
MIINRLAWRQLTSEKLRLLAAGAGITFAVLLQLMQFGFRDALYTSATLVHSRLLADLVMTSPQYEFIISPGSFPKQRLREAMQFKEVESVSSLEMGIVPFRDPLSRKDRQVLMLAFNPDEPVFDLTLMNTDASKLRVADAVFVDARSRADVRPVIEYVQREGSIRADVAGRRVDVAGLVEFGVSFTGNANMVTNDATFRKFIHRPEGPAEIGLLRLKPGSSVDAVQAALTATLPPDVKIMTPQQFADLELSYWNKNSPIGFVFNLGVVVGLMVGAVIVYQILYTDVSDHLPEYATLKAMGYRDRALSLVVLQQSLILSVVGFPIGYVLAEGLYALARQATGLPIIMTLSRVVLVFGLTVAMCGGSGLLAIRKLKSADPADAF